MQHCAFAQSSSNKLRDIFPKKHCCTVLTGMHESVCCSCFWTKVGGIGFVKWDVIWEEPSLAWRSFLEWHHKNSLISTAFLLIVRGFKFNHCYGCRGSWKSESQKLHKCLGFLILFILVRTKGDLSVCLQCFPAALLLLQCPSFQRNYLTYPIISVTFLGLGSERQTMLVGCWSYLLSTRWKDRIERISANFISWSLLAFLISFYDTENGETVGPKLRTGWVKTPSMSKANKQNEVTINESKKKTQNCITAVDVVRIKPIILWETIKSNN